MPLTRAYCHYCHKERGSPQGSRSLRGQITAAGYHCWRTQKYNVDGLPAAGRRSITAGLPECLPDLAGEPPPELYVKSLWIAESLYNNKHSAAQVRMLAAVEPMESNPTYRRPVVELRSRLSWY
jgi:hypothetical protein